MLISRALRPLRYLAPVAVMSIAACSDSTGPGGKMSAADRAALNTLMTNPAVVTAMFSGASYGAAMMPLIAANVSELGEFSIGAGASANLVIPAGIRAQVGAGAKYRAFGGQFIMKVKPVVGAEQNVVWTGIIAVNNLQSPTDVLSLGITESNKSSASTSVAATTFGTTSGNRTASGVYIKLNGQQATSRSATTGSIAIESASFSGGANCPGVSQQPIIKACNYGYGTVKGNFVMGFPAAGGSPILNVPATNVSLPSTRLTIELDMSNFAF